MTQQVNKEIQTLIALQANEEIPTIAQQIVETQSPQVNEEIPTIAQQARVTKNPQKSRSW